MGCFAEMYICLLKRKQSETSWGRGGEDPKFIYVYGEPMSAILEGFWSIAMVFLDGVLEVEKLTDN